MRKFVVSSYPFVHSKNDINKMFLYVSMSLVIPVIYGTLFFGINTLLITIASIISCFVAELLFNIINSKSYFVDDFSFFVTAMILALTMPVYVPIYVVMVSAFIAIFITKMVFGGLGKNKLNPALVGRCVAGVISQDLAVNAYNFYINGELYKSFTAGGTNSVYNLLMGQSIGGIGTTCILILLLCFIFLVYTGTVDFKIPLFSVLAYFVTGLLFCGIEQTVMNMLSGSFIFASIFIVTDPNTSPNSFVGKFIYSVLFGSLSAVLWHFGMLGENTIFAVALFVNFLAPVLDKYVRLRPIALGGFRNAYKI